MSKHYKSTGTIHLKNKGKKEFVLFVPDKDHYVKHQGEEYAVFLSKGSYKDAKIKPFKKGLDLVKLKLNSSKMKTSLRDAAMNQSKIGVKVKLDGKWLKLIGITVPAPSDK